MSKRKKKYPKAIKKSKISKTLDDYLNSFGYFEDTDLKEKYNVFYKNKWIGSIYYKKDYKWW